MSPTSNNNTDLDDSFELDLSQPIQECSGVPMEEVKGIQRRVRKANKYSLEETATRNVLIVGRTRTGKSTAVGVMKDPCYKPKKMSIFSDTVDPKFASFSLDDKLKGTKYTVNIIDTPGLKEVKEKGEVARSDEAIMSTINLCLKNEITKVNTLLIFISFELGVTQDDVDAFEQYLKAFSHKDISICMCITRAEEKTKYWKESIIKQLKEHKFFSEVLERENVFVRFIGCVEESRFNTTTNSKDLQNFYISVYQMREALLQVIFESKNQVKLIDLPISTNLKSQLNALFEKQEQILNRLMNVSDYTTAEVKLLISEFSENTDRMIQQEGLLYDKQFYKRFQTLKNSVVAIIPRIEDEESKTQFQGKLIL